MAPYEARTCSYCGETIERNFKTQYQRFIFEGTQSYCTARCQFQAHEDARTLEHLRQLSDDELSALTSDHVGLRYGDGPEECSTCKTLYPCQRLHLIETVMIERRAA